MIHGPYFWCEKPENKQAAWMTHMIDSDKILILVPFVFGETWGTFKSGENVFVAFIDADYNQWLWNYIKITQFSNFISCC